mmetsp:Transcript_19363/g.41666  ORF Transcript_19363/g.41666 Transcript_19363/m.41666 type:complete len:121 (+) Transcript_19363:501-863(+)
MHADIDWHAFAQCKKSGCIQGHRKIAQVEISFRTKEVQGTQAARRAPRTKLARGATALAFPEDVTFAFWAARYTSVDELEKPYTMLLSISRRSGDVRNLRHQSDDSWVLEASRAGGRKFS